MEQGEQPMTATEIHQQVKRIKVGSLYRMAEAGRIPCLHTGARGRGKLFFLSEVVEAMRVPVERPPVKRANTGKKKTTGKTKKKATTKAGNEAKG